MKRIKIHRHPDCARCTKFAFMHRRFDWLNRIEDTTAAPATGPVQLGQVVVEDLQTHRTFQGAQAFQMICRNVPAFFPFRMLMWLPTFRGYVERDTNECNPKSCNRAPHDDHDNAT